MASDCNQNLANQLMQLVCWIIHNALLLCPSSRIHCIYKGSEYKLDIPQQILTGIQTLILYGT